MERPPSHAAKVLLALFEAGAPLERALERLRALGVPDQALDVLSTLPLSQAPGHQPSAVPLHRWTLAGGVLGLLFGAGLAAGTSLMYPLQTGGLSIVAPPVMALIGYEGMMLGAMLLTVLVMARRIHRLRHVPHEPRVHDGVIGVSIMLGDHMPPATVLRGALQEAGALEVNER